MSRCFSSRAPFLSLVLVAAALGLAGCGPSPGRTRPVSLAVPGLSVALLPLENLSGAIGAGAKVTSTVRLTIKEAGYRPVDEEALERTLKRRRIRHTALLTREQVEEIGREFSPELILVGSVDLYVPTERPQVGVSLRALSPKDGSVLWAGTLGISGESFMGPLGTGMITDIGELSEVVVGQLVADLRRDYADGERAVAIVAPTKRPYAYVAPSLSWEEISTVAVLPLENYSARKDAGIIASSVFVQRLLTLGKVRVADPGEVDRALGTLRLLSTTQISRAELKEMGRLLSVRAILTGTVDAYEEVTGSGGGVTRVELHARLLEAGTGKILWSSWHKREGDDTVVLLHFGLTRTALALLDKAVADMIGALSSGIGSSVKGG